MALSLASNLAWEGDGPLGRPVLLPALIQEASNKASPPAAPGAKICWAVEGARRGAPAESANGHILRLHLIAGPTWCNLVACEAGVLEQFRCACLRAPSNPKPTDGAYSGLQSARAALRGVGAAALRYISGCPGVHRTCIARQGRDACGGRLGSSHSARIDRL